MAEEKKPIQVKLTEEQRALLDAAAEARGLPTSSYIRTVALEDAREGSASARLRDAVKAALHPDEA